MADRNAESHFGQVEVTDIKRSIFPLEFRNLSTCNAGDIVPFLAYSDLLPGDTIKCETSAVVRMQTPLNPTMDDCFVDTYYFLIPHRIVWDHWEEFMGVTDNGWTASTQYQVPMITAPANTGVTKGTIADYMGIPKGITNITYQALPFRAYVKTYNTWFRPSSLVAPAQLHTDDTDRNGDNTVAELGGTPFKATKLADFITSALPEAQKPIPGFTGAMTIPLGTSAPVYTGMTNPVPGTTTPLQWAQTGTAITLSGDHNIYGHTSTSDNKILNTRGDLSTSYTPGSTTGSLYPANLYADLTNATAATINALRLSFQIQKLFELRARTGTGRYFDVLKGEFGTAPNTSVLQEPEYLGGKRTPINLTQITQTSSTVNNGQALGETGGMSHTVFSNEDFTKSITEHSILLGVMIVRQYHSYQQNLDRMWSRRDKLDYYTPLLAHLGEMPIFKKEIMATGTSTDNQVWGYQERWAEYKYGKHIITGEMNSTYSTSLDIWHYGDYYANVPTLSQTFLEETPDYIDRTLAVAHTTADQFKFDIITNITATRPMPVYCTPGLIDHF